MTQVFCTTKGHEDWDASRYVTCEGEGCHPYCHECAETLIRSGEIDLGPTSGESRRSTWEAENMRILGERNRYCLALTRIAKLEHVNAADQMVNVAGRIAREALAGGQP